MDRILQFRREVRAFEAAVRAAAGTPSAPLVPTCPGWSVADLIMHLGGVHRLVGWAIRDRLTALPDTTDRSFLELPADPAGWPDPENAPNLGPIPPGLIDWFVAGAADLEARFAGTDPDERAWSWSQEQTAGFWLRMQTIEAAVHRWDAENVIAATQPVPAELAVDAVSQSFEVMAPARRSWLNAPPGAGERYRFRRSDGPETWTVSFEGADIRLVHAAEPCDVELVGTASDLMLFLWQRVPADRLTVTGDREVLDGYFTLVPPL